MQRTTPVILSNKEALHSFVPKYGILTNMRMGILSKKMGHLSAIQHLQCRIRICCLCNAH
jgi:hypothetical protein